MLKWFGHKQSSTYQPPHGTEMDGALAEDPLDLVRKFHENYTINRANPLFEENHKNDVITYCRHKSLSSGYSGSNQSSNNPEFFVTVVDQNEEYVKSIQIGNTRKLAQSRRSSSSGTGVGNLSAIPEGKIDRSIPNPIWPDERDLSRYRTESGDSLVDENLLLYTSFSYVPEPGHTSSDSNHISVKDLLQDLSDYVNNTSTILKNTDPERVLEKIKEKITASLEALKLCTEEEVRRLCINLSHKANSNCVVRALSNSSSSGDSSQGSPEWSGGRERTRTYSSDTDEIYHIPSGSSSSGFSDTNKQCAPRLVEQDDLRNALIYATLYKTKVKLTDAAASNLSGSAVNEKLFVTASDGRPSVWEQYYGAGPETDGNNFKELYVLKPNDVPVFPGGRPEADFTLDLPRSEFLSKKMKKEKKWRFRCRLFTTFLGFVFFLLSVMAVSLILTRGKKMFGSMV